MFFKFYKQLDWMDCGPTCLRMIAKHYGRNYTQETISKLSEINREGVSLLGLSAAAENIGFRSLGAKVTITQLTETSLPCILHWRQNHFVVLYKVKADQFYLADPAVGIVKLSIADFKRNWQSDNNTTEGIALMVSPSPKFYEQQDESDSGVDWSFLWQYLVSYRKMIVQLVFGLGVGSLLQLIAPFLTQAIVDIGINTRNQNFIYIILLAQFALIIGRVSVDFIRSWILLHISTRINISILTDFLIKLMKLPMGFFDVKMTGDIMQRMNDQRVIQNFLTGSALTSVFSILSLLLFSTVLAYYNITIFFVFTICSLFYASWIVLFLKRRRTINYKNFEVSAKNQSSIVQLISGMQEIKLNNCERQKRWEWEHIQARLFKLNIKTLALSQYQQGGATLINEGKNILITFLSASAVIHGQLSLGGMLAIQYIAGQLAAPVEQLLAFIQGFQDAKISLERLNEIHRMKDEDESGKKWKYDLPDDKTLTISDLSFCYPGAGNEPVLDNINLVFPRGKTTAIVGMSGSGKTTILKLLLRFYEPKKGGISIGGYSINEIAFNTWRSQCGVVMQDGFIFSDSIERNIAVGDDQPDNEKMQHAISIANIKDFITELPLGLKTKIGAEGNGISQGQRQRILIARAVYKNPHYIFFDEATNALDSNNELVIMKNLEKFFTDRTVVIVAHRLSTVRNSDNIILLDEGRIVEQGTHDELTTLKGAYYRLVRNQLELGL
jgi:ATP-binding cassette subfamily B protein